MSQMRIRQRTKMFVHEWEGTVAKRKAALNRGLLSFSERSLGDSKPSTFHLTLHRFAWRRGWLFIDQIDT